MILELIDTITTTDLNKILFLAYTHLQSHITSQKSLPAKEFSKTNTKTIQPKCCRKAYKRFKTRHDQWIKTLHEYKPLGIIICFPSNFSPCVLISFLISSWHVPDFGYSFGGLLHVMFLIILVHVQVLQLHAALLWTCPLLCFTSLESFKYIPWIHFPPDINFPQKIFIVFIKLYATDMTFIK